jgi:hypothetical protein
MNYMKHNRSSKSSPRPTLANPCKFYTWHCSQFWNCNFASDPISINRDGVMRLVKSVPKPPIINASESTRFELHQPEPSYNPFKEVMSFYSIFPKISNQPQNPKIKKWTAFELVDEQALNKSYTSSGTSTEQAVVPSINYINNTNIANKKNVANGNEQAKKSRNNADFKKKKLKMKCPCIRRHR